METTDSKQSKQKDTGTKNNEVYTNYSFQIKDALISPMRKQLHYKPHVLIKNYLHFSRHSPLSPFLGMKQKRKYVKSTENHSNT